MKAGLQGHLSIFRCWRDFTSDVGVFSVLLSFNGNKIITTSHGGALLTNDRDIADKARFLATQAREDKPYYEHIEVGYNYRLSNVSAGIGRGQMLHLDEHVDAKVQIYHRYAEGLKGLPLTMNPYLPETNPNHWLSCILLDENCGVTPDKIRESLAKLNVEARPIWKPMHLQPLFRDYTYVSMGEDVSKDLFERGLCLPSDIKMTEAEQQMIIKKIRKCFEGVSGVSKIR